MNERLSCARQAALFAVAVTLEEMSTTANFGLTLARIRLPDFALRARMRREEVAKRPKTFASYKLRVVPPS